MKPHDASDGQKTFGASRATPRQTRRQVEGASCVPANQVVAMFCHTRETSVAINGVLRAVIPLVTVFWPGPPWASVS